MPIPQLPSQGQALPIQLVGLRVITLAPGQAAGAIERLRTQFVPWAQREGQMPRFPRPGRATGATGRSRTRTRRSVATSKRRATQAHMHTHRRR